MICRALGRLPGRPSQNNPLHVVSIRVCGEIGDYKREGKIYFIWSNKGDPLYLNIGPALLLALDHFTKCGRYCARIWQ